MTNFKLTADSTCDLSENLLKKYDISIIGLNIILGDTTYIDRENVTPDDIYVYYDQHKVLPKTAARNSEEYKDLFMPYVSQGKAVVHFSLSSEISSSYNNACLAAAEINKHGKKVWVINTKLLSSGNGVLAMRIHDLLKSGEKIETAVEKVTSLIERTQLSFCVDTLEYLYKGGRCSQMALIGGSVLKIHPCINMSEGQLSVSTKFKGSMKKVLKTYVDMLKEKYTPDKSICFVTHSVCDSELVEYVKTRMKEEFGFKEIIEQDAGCTIVSHCGKGTLGVLFFCK